MATTAVHRTQDFLLSPNRFPSEATPSSSLFKHHRNPNPNPQSAPSRCRKRSPVGSPIPRFSAKNLVMGEVKILKRGEEIPQSQSPPPPPEAKKSNRRFRGENLVVCSTDRLGSDPETVENQIRVSDSEVIDGLYAGSATFLASPPPSALPVPAFFTKKKNNAAASDLRRLLNLV